VLQEKIRTTRFQHPANLLETALRIGDRAEDQRSDNGIEGVVRIGEHLHVGLFDGESVPFSIGIKDKITLSIRLL